MPLRPRTWRRPLASRDCAAGGRVPRLQIHPLLVRLGNFYGSTELCGGGNRNYTGHRGPGLFFKRCKLITMHGCSAETDWWCKTPTTQKSGALSSAKGPVASGTVIWLLQRPSKCNKNEARWHGNTTRPIKSKDQCPPIHWPSYEVPGANTKIQVRLDAQLATEQSG